MTTLNTNQYRLLVDEIYDSIMAQPDNGMGEMGEARDEAERIIQDWCQKADIAIEGEEETEEN